jgi:hypothetical protein
MINTMIKISSSSIHPKEPTMLHDPLSLLSTPRTQERFDNTKGGEPSSNWGEAIEIREISQV